MPRQARKALPNPKNSQKTDFLGHHTRGKDAARMWLLRFWGSFGQKCLETCAQVPVGACGGECCVIPFIHRRSGAARASLHRQKGREPTHARFRVRSASPTEFG